MPYSDLHEIDRGYLQAYDDGLRTDESIFSKNTKTTYSVDLPIARTCWPTAICGKVCYGARRGAPQAKDLDALRKQVRVWRYIRQTEATIVAARIAGEYERRGMTFLRWCGVGDLFSEAVRVINTIAHRHPHITQWLVTRRPEFAAKITRTSENLYLMFSLDATPDSRRRMAEVAALQHPRLYFSFLRTRPNDDTLGARVVFTEQRTGSLPNDHRQTVCPADAGVMAFKGACARCRRCFSARALDGSRHPGSELHRS